MTTIDDTKRITVCTRCGKQSRMCACGDVPARFMRISPRNLRRMAAHSLHWPWSWLVRIGALEEVEA